MKTLLIICCLLTALVTIDAQAFITIEPGFGQPGLMYADKQIPMYCRIRHGSVKTTHTVANYAKFSGGVTIPTNTVKIMAGITYGHLYNRRVVPAVDLSAHKKISIEIGWIGKLTDHLFIMAVTDPINWETDFGISIPF